MLYCASFIATIIQEMNNTAGSIILYISFFVIICIIVFFACFTLKLLEYQKNKNNFDNRTNSEELDSEICHNIPSETSDTFDYSIADTYAKISGIVFKEDKKAIVEKIRGQCSDYLKVNPAPDIDNTGSFVNIMKKNFMEIGSIKDIVFGFLNKIMTFLNNIMFELNNMVENMSSITDFGVLIFGLVKIIYMIIVNFITLIVMLICKLLKLVLIVMIAVLIAACSLGPFTIIPCLIMLGILIVPIIFLSVTIAFLCIFVVNALLLLMVAKVGYQVRLKTHH